MAGNWFKTNTHAPEKQEDISVLILTLCPSNLAKPLLLSQVLADLAKVNISLLSLSVCFVFI